MGSPFVPFVRRDAITLRRERDNVSPYTAFALSRGAIFRIFLSRLRMLSRIMRSFGARNAGRGIGAWRRCTMNGQRAYGWAAVGLFVGTLAVVGPGCAAGPIGATGNVVLSVVLFE
jgi:hypothetical protein